MTKNKETIFPEDTAGIIERLIKKHQLKSFGGTLLEELKKNKKIIEYEIIKIIREVKEGQVNKKDLSLELQKKLELTPEKSKKLAKDIKEYFFTARQKSKKTKNKDEYRESIE